VIEFGQSANQEQKHLRRKNPRYGRGGRAISRGNYQTIVFAAAIMREHDRGQSLIPLTGAARSVKDFKNYEGSKDEYQFLRSKRTHSTNSSS
jgi:hypothetical protein